MVKSIVRNETEWDIYIGMYYLLNMNLHILLLDINNGTIKRISNLFLLNI